MKLEISSQFKESNIKAETYFATSMSMISITRPKSVKVSMRILTDYMDCKVNIKLSQDSFDKLINALKENGSIILTGKDQDYSLNVQVKQFNGSNIGFIRYDVCNQPICCFKLTQNQIDQIVNCKE